MKAMCTFGSQCDGFEKMDSQGTWDLPYTVVVMELLL